MQIQNFQVRTRLPIGKNLLEILLDQTDEYFLSIQNQPYLTILYKSLFASAYYGMLRVGEITSGEHPVRVFDVHVAGNKNKILFILRTSKTHWKDSKPQCVKISSTSMNKKSEVKLKYCPFNILQTYIACQKQENCHYTEPFFIFRDGLAVSL